MTDDPLPAPDMKRKPNPSLAVTPLRHGAETRLRARSGKSPSVVGVPRSNADSKRLLHELQVHQIELEMQNEELRKARDEMETGLEKYSELYDFAPVGYLTLDRGGAIREANLTAASLLGVARAPLMTQRLGILVAPADRPRFDAFLTQIFEGRTPTDCDVRLLVKGKPPVDVRLRANLFESEQACRMAMTDITEHKHAEDQVRVSEIRFRRLFEAAQDGVLLLDPATGKITDANPFMTKLLGYPHAQLVGKKLSEIGLIQDEAASREMFQKLKREHEVRYDDLPLESQNGQHQEVEVVANLYQENGRAVIQCNIRDITERRRAEAALRTSEERFRALFDLGPVGVYSCDITGAIREFNRTAVSLWGRTPKLRSASERFCGSFRLYLPDGTLMPHSRCPMAMVLSGQRAEARDVEVVIGRPDGSRKTCIVNIVPLTDSHGEITGAINCFYDITERKHVEEALAAAQAKLAAHAAQLESMVTTRTRQLTATNQRLETAVRFTRKAKEEFRTLFLEAKDMQRRLRQLTHQILTAQEEERKKISRELHDEVVQMLVGINVELSALVHGNSAEVRDLKDKIAHTQRLVEKSVDSVHRFARELRPAVLDDLGLIPALHAYCRSLAERKKIKIKMAAFGGVEALDIDRRTVLFRVAQEALTNIARHARATRVSLSITRIPGAIRMEIADNGKSFSVKKTLLAKNNKRLGLVGMRERVEMVDGSLTIDSAPGAGTTVCAEIPFNPEKIKK